MFFLLARSLHLFCTLFSTNNMQRTVNENNAQLINVLQKIGLYLASVPLVGYIIWIISFLLVKYDLASDTVGAGTDFFIECRHTISLPKRGS